MNHVTPQRVKVDKRVDKDNVIEVSTDEYLVDVEALPGLVARGVMPYRFLEMRADFSTRFKGVEDPAGVRRVLRGEGYYG
jgi:hypothetical protein